MQDMEKAEEINRAILELSGLNHTYQLQAAKYFFDYNKVLGLLYGARKAIEDSLCCECPEKFPNNLPWCGEVPTECTEEPDPCTMGAVVSDEDYALMHLHLDEDRRRAKHEQGR